MGTVNKFIVASFGGDWFFSKNNVGRKNIFEVKVKDCMAIVAKYVSELSHHPEILICFYNLEKTQSLWIVKCNFKIMENLPSSHCIKFQKGCYRMKPKLNSLFGVHYGELTELLSN